MFIYWGNKVSGAVPLPPKSPNFQTVLSIKFTAPSTSKIVPVTMAAAGEGKFNKASANRLGEIGVLGSGIQNRP